MTEDARPLSCPRRPPLARALRGIRGVRRLRASEVAKALGISPRAYRDYESGRRVPPLDLLGAFARATDCDAAALLVCAGGAGPELALNCLNNKGLSIAVGALEEAQADLASAFQTLTGADLVAAFETARQQLRDCAIAKSRARLDQEDDPSSPITSRQLECLRWAQAGKSSTDIGVILAISPRTVDTHLGEACARLGVRTRVQAISLAIVAGLLSPLPP